jgi:hypothetical protein
MAKSAKVIAAAPPPPATAPPVHEGFWGLSPEAWTAIGTLGIILATVALAAVTLALVIVGRRQIREVREENRRGMTLAACGNYDLNPIIYECTKRLSEAREAGELKTKARELRPQITTVLNYLDSIAIGIDQGLYIETLAWDHLHPIVSRHVKELIDSGVIEDAGLAKENFSRLLEMHRTWSRARPRFQDNSR